MAFQIGFTNTYVFKRDEAWWCVYSEGDEDWPAVCGVIVLGDHREDLLSPLSHWRERDYRRQWQEGLSRTLSGEARSCLVHRMYEPALSECLMWWAMYRFETEIAFQEHLVFTRTLDLTFDEGNPYDHVYEYEAVSEEGDPISEWRVPLADVEVFYSSQAVKWAAG